MTNVRVQPDKPAASPAAEDLPRDTCPFCRAQIAKGSKICINCKSDLSWKRYLTVSNAMLVLFAAVLGVGGTIALQLDKLLTPDDSAISATLIGENPSERLISVLVTNDGPRKGSILDAALELPFITDLKTEHVEFVSIPIKLVNGVVNVPERSSQQVNFKFDPLNPDKPPGVVLNRGFAREGSLKNLGKDSLLDLPNYSQVGTATVMMTPECRMRLSIVSAKGEESDLTSRFECSRVAQAVILANAAVMAHVLPPVRAPSPASASK